MKILTGILETDNVPETLKTVTAIAESCGSSAVIIDAAKVAGKNHIEAAVTHAHRSFAAGTAIARTLPMEILVYASGQRQCSCAAKFGLHAGKNTVYIVIDGGDEEKTAKLLREQIFREGPVDPADTAVLMQEFAITAEELAIVGADRIEELVIERVALVDAGK
ncbi:MAG TPA: KEOPS complex subunit Cgi121 [Methanocorpusculum sp.]|nr:KEOPS complex subunit Cgi121 [Methanocorpusculum sp.]